MRAAPYRRSFCLATLVALSACDRTSPLAPAIDRPLAASVASVNPPSGLSAVATSQTRIDLTWQDNASNETGFEVRRSTNGADGNFVIVATTAANATTYADTGLAPATQYCYKVRAFSVGRNTTSYSVITDPACATTFAPPVTPGPPDTPSDAYAGASGSREVGVRWSDNANNEDGFRVERSTDGGATWVTVATSAANISSITDYDALSEAQACYRVSAFNGEGVSAPSNTSCATPIAGPTDFAADRQGLLTWTDNSAIEDGYEVWMMDAFGIAYDGFVATLPANTTSFQTGGCGGWCHGFAVVAIKDGAYSDWATVMLPPGVPVNLTAAAVSAGEIDLAWADQPNAGELPAQQFEIERCTGDGSACGDADFQIASFVIATTFRDLQVLPGTTYTYRVRGWINVLYSNPSNTATATVP